jgi:hypothetical protein
MGDDTSIRSAIDVDKMLLVNNNDRMITAVTMIPRLIIVLLQCHQLPTNANMINEWNIRHW